MQQRVSIEISQANFERDCMEGIKDACNMFNDLMEHVEKITATKLMHLIEDDPQARRAAYHENATKIRGLSALALLDDIRSHLPRNQANGMLQPM